MARRKADEGDPKLRALFEEFSGQLVSPGGAAALLGVSRQTIHTLGERGKLRMFRSDDEVAGRLLKGGPRGSTFRLRTSSSTGWRWVAPCLGHEFCLTIVLQWQHGAIDSRHCMFVADRASQGRINSPATERDYRATLLAHAEDVDNRDPRKTGREDVKTTLRRWKHPNSQGKHRSILIAFYDWMLEEGLRETNPALLTPRPKRRKPTVYRLTRDEARAMIRACQSERERWAIHLALLTGARRAELLGFQGRHFRRPDLVHISGEIAKGNRERWVPVLPELAPIVREIQRLEDDDYVLCA